MESKRVFIFDDPIAGFSHRENDIRKLARKKYKKDIDENPILSYDSFKEAADYGIYLEDVSINHNPNNKYDKNAIEVYSGKVLIGFIPKSENKKVLDKLENLENELQIEAVYLNEEEEHDIYLQERVMLTLYYDYQ